MIVEAYKNRILAFFAASLFFSSCSTSDNNTSLQTDFYKNVKPAYLLSKGYRTLNLDSIASFPWDSVYFFRGEESAGFISDLTGINWNGPSVPNLHKRLLFVHQKKVVTYFDCGEESPNGEQNEFPNVPIELFTCPDSGLRNRHRVFARKDAKFAVYKKKFNRRFYLILVPLRCTCFFMHTEDTISSLK